jgi:DNA-binding transcriptional ArsR family regulator
VAVDRLSLVFAALADPTRRDLVARLAEGDASVGELAAPYDVSVQAVSKHLKVLEQAGVVSRAGQGRRSPVRLEAGTLGLMTDWLEHYRRQAERRYQRLDAVLAAMAPEAMATEAMVSEAVVPRAVMPAGTHEAMTTTKVDADATVAEATNTEGETP